MSSLYRVGEKGKVKMGMFHAMYRPYDINSKVKVIKEGALCGKVGTVTRRDPEEMFRAEDGVYFVTFDGETEECQERFLYWDLEPV